MTHLLHLDSSAAHDASISRQLGRELVLGWSRRDPAMVLTYRDLDAEPLPFVSDTWVSAAFSPPEAHDHRLSFALQRSEQLIAELMAADVLVLGAPMYNLGIPASLKAWIDQVVRVGRTFGYDGPTPVGLVHGKRAIVLATSGGDAVRYADAGMDFRTPYLRTILAFIGITDVEVLTVCDTMGGGADLDAARVELDALLDRQVTPALVPAQA
jgi:FMN-dependent NADH-azoreductase